MNTIDIGWLQLGIGFLLLLIPIAVFAYFRTGLVSSLLIAFGRMTVQLLLVGLYLEYIFDLDAWWLNSLWVLVMTLTATHTIIRRSDLRQKFFFPSVLAGVFIGMAIPALVFLAIVLELDNVTAARYMIPIVGMILGNCLTSAIIGIRSFYQTIRKSEETYKFRIMTGATRNEALFDYFRDALKDAFSPTIANTATMGIISLPGMMTGQILGGSDPTVAIKYQIMIMIAVMSASVMTVFISVASSRSYVFDEFGRFRQNIFKESES
ncbi:MAG: ABC transporter permease [Candidatus Kapaibacterium sp.]